MNSQSRVEHEFREMNNSERALIDRLFEQLFPGSVELLSQMENCLVRSLDENGSLDFMIAVADKAPVHSPVPVEAEAEDVDRITIHILLHVIGGIAQGIEVYKENSARVIQFPASSALRLFSPP